MFLVRKIFNETKNYKYFLTERPKTIVKPTFGLHETRIGALVPESNPAFNEERKFRAGLLLNLNELLFA
jgi:hypothetical protein